MKIVIVGAGAIGMAVAGLLSNENHDVILIDNDDVALEKASQDLDIAVRHGEGTDWKLLEEIMERSPDLFLALTSSDEVNMTSCTIAKGLGFAHTVARIRKWDYLNQTRLDFGRMFAVDHFICPELLAAEEVDKYLLSLGSVRMESYAHGAAQMRTLRIPKKWAKAGKNLSELELPQGMMVGLICRTFAAGKGKAGAQRQQIIFPHGNDLFEGGDEVTVIGKTDAIEQAHIFFGVPQHRISSAVVIGGGLVGQRVAKTMSDRGVDVRLLETDRRRCEYLSQNLPYVTVINHDGTDLAFLQAERIDQADVVVACTESEEKNVLISLLAREVGADHVVALVADPALAPILRDRGVAYLVSAQASAANRVMAIAQAGKVIASSSLYDNRAKILEIKVSVESKIVGIPLTELGPSLPRDFLFAVIQNRGRTMIANGQRTLCPGDNAIVITRPDQTEKMLELF